MSARPLIAVLPKPLKPDDEIILKGQIRPDPIEFSVNFANDENPTPIHIAYHFKIHFQRNLIIQNYKVSNQWYDETIMDNDFFDSDNLEFYLKFAVSNSEISTYQCFDYQCSECSDYGRVSENFICSFPLVLTLDGIKTIQVWGDVEKVTEIMFKYK